MAKLRVEIVTGERVVFTEEGVDMVVAPGADGTLGILPQHAPLMTAISNTGTATITELDGKSSELFVSDGFAQVQHNVLTLVCEAGEFAHEIDLERVKAAEAKAREKMAGLDRLSAEFLKAEASLRKALAREMLARRGSGSGTLG